MFSRVIEIAILLGVVSSLLVSRLETCSVQLVQRGRT